MKFVFVCPEKQNVFERASFEINNNKGIALNMKGNKSLNSKVKINKPCSFCSIKHVYHASELSCPFECPEKEKNIIRGNNYRE